MSKNWEVPFVVFRHRGDGQFAEVFQTSDFKKAKYWLTYIAEVGDVLCKTPQHPKHSGASQAPEYWGHKEKSGGMSSNENEWRDEVLRKSTPVFPTSPLKSYGDYI